jgi:hypothetical protein
MTDKDLLEELKHSIKTHLVIMNGPSQQLCVFLIKLIDLLEDQEPIRKRKEMEALIFAIVEAVALHVQDSVDVRGRQAAARGQTFPVHIQHQANNLLVIVGKSRGLPEKLVAKIAVLREVADTLRALSSFTKAKYPDITDVAGNIL